MRRRSWAMGIAAAMVVAYASLGAAVDVWPRSALDLGVAEAIQRATPLDAVMRGASMFGGTPVSVVLPVAAIGGLLLARARWEAVWLAASTLGAVAIEHATKLFVFHARPTAPLIVRVDVAGTGYPSGHVNSYVALFGFLAVVAWCRITNRVARGCAVVAAVLPIVLVGPSRVYLGAHWPSDALGGYLAGGAWLLVSTWCYRFTSAWQPPRSP